MGGGGAHDALATTRERACGRLLCAPAREASGHPGAQKPPPVWGVCLIYSLAWHGCVVGGGWCRVMGGDVLGGVVIIW